MKNRTAGVMTNLVILIFGFLSLAAPFIVPQTRNVTFLSASSPIMSSVVLVLCLIIILFEIQTSIIDNKLIALLGMLIAINASFRFLENAIPGPAGFSPVFFLIILTGYYFGSRIGFLTGTMTMFVSGLMTGGIGPWLPGQMITAGWVGQSAALLSPLIRKFKWRGTVAEIILLIVFSALWGLLYGVVLNLWFWPYLVSIGTQSWVQGVGLIENLQRYAVYYFATSLIWDITRALGNILMMTFLAKPVLAILERFKNRFIFQYTPRIES